MKTVEIIIAICFVVAIYLFGYLRGVHVQRKIERDREPVDPNACQWGQEETGGYFIGRRYCHRHGQTEDDPSAERCHRGLVAEALRKPRLLAPGMPVEFEQGVYVCTAMTADFEDGKGWRLNDKGKLEEVELGSKVRTHVQMVDLESWERDNRIVGA